MTELERIKHVHEIISKGHTPIIFWKQWKIFKNQPILKEYTNSGKMLPDIPVKQFKFFS